MNPLDYSGPGFLFFYVLASTLAVIGTRRILPLIEPSSTPHLGSLDPYSIAYLRGGAQEALRVTILVLLDRALLTEQAGSLTAAQDALQRVRRPLERAVLMHFKASAKAKDTLRKPSLRAGTESLRRELTEQGLLLDAPGSMRRLALFGFVTLLLFGLSVAKVAVALSRGHHNIELLLILTLVSITVAMWPVFAQRTLSADRALAEISALCQGLYARRATIAVGQDDYDFAMLIGVYGFDAHPESSRLGQTLFPEPVGNSTMSSSTGSSDSSCSSGSSCGGGCGGGGCGGCGS